MPLVKFPYSKMRTSVSRFRAQGGVDVPLGADAPEFFEIDCPEWIEAKANNVIGAYQHRSGAPDDSTSPSLRLFSLLHSRLQSLLPLVNKLRNIALETNATPGRESQMLMSAIIRPRLDAVAAKFDLSLLVDFSERPLLQNPVEVELLQPLVRRPGCLMLTDARLYFQPAQLNNTGEAVAKYRLRQLRAVHRRRFLTRAVALEIELVDSASRSGGASADAAYVVLVCRVCR